MSNQFSRIKQAQGGFSLIELMVAVVIGLFITLGLTQMFVSMYSTKQSQGVLAQYQDNQRMALAMLTNNINQAGYYYVPTGSSTVPLQSTALPAPTSANADGSSFQAGNGIVGAGDGTSATGDSINVYYSSSGTDNVTNCQGGTVTVPTTFINSFSVDSSGNLNCTVTSTVVSSGTTTTSGSLTLATGIKSMTILYGLDIAGIGSVSSYMTGAALNTLAATASRWGDVSVVQITLNFYNPNVLSPGATLTTTTPWVQYINVMQ